jgi:hypothetical protein
MVPNFPKEISLPAMTDEARGKGIIPKEHTIAGVYARVIEEALSKTRT